jgi:hypothetical protein
VPTPSWQFWTDWAVKAAGVVATLVAVLVALFRDGLLYRLTPPRLILSLVSPEGHFYLSNRPDGSGKTTDGFWYHARVENKRPWNPASDLYIYLLSIEEADAAGDLKGVWIGEAPLTWRHEGNIQQKKIGYQPAECDLFHILKEPLALYLSPIIPISVSPNVFQKACRIALTLQARGPGGGSPRYRVEISWNGGWSDDKSQRAHNLVIKMPQIAG